MNFYFLWTIVPHVVTKTLSVLTLERGMDLEKCNKNTKCNTRIGLQLTNCL